MFALSCLDIINSFFIAFKVALTTKKVLSAKEYVRESWITFVYLYFISI